MKNKVALLMVALFGISQFSTAQALLAPVETAPFPDVSDQNYKEAITKLKDAGIVQGYENGDFKPTTDMNRAEFMKVLIGSITKEPKGKNCFDDVREEWYAPYICEGKSRGIVSGDDTNPKMFRPAEKIKFSEAAKIVAKTYSLQGGEKDAKAWYKEFITELQNKKAIPLSVEYYDENVSREEMSEMVWRLKDKVEDKASRTYDEIGGKGLVTASSCADLQARYVKATTYLYRDDFRAMDTKQSIPMPIMVPMEDALSVQNATGAVSAETKSPDAGAAKDYSSTNVQVEGVDEADVIKNDGKYIYLIKGNSVRIVEAYPATSMKELISFSLGEENKNENFYPTEMYVDGNTLVVIGTLSYYNNYPQPLMDTTSADAKMAATSIMPVYYQNRVRAYVVDITNHSKPVIQRSVEFEGNYSASRKIGSTLYMVMNQYPSYPIYYGIEQHDKDIKAMDIMPKMKDSVKGTDELAVPCNKVRILPKPQTFNFLIAAAIPLKDKTQSVEREVIVGNVQNLYVSQNNLYVASTEWAGGFYNPYSQSENTMIYKFALDKNSIEYKNQSSAPGQILNQFSMDEKDGNFRIATTKNNYSGGNKSTNNLYVFDKDMKMVGKVEGIAPGESIYSVRFMGNRAYMVTFKQIDPLFVIDLTTPTSPKVLGKLKVPGYSNYLHPYDENHIMGFGKEVDESIDADKVHSEDAVYYTAVQGMKLGMFDVTDVNNPKEMFKEVIGDNGTESELLYNHKALLFNKEKGLLAFPITVNEIPKDTQCSGKTYSSCPSNCQKICMPSSCSYENGIKVCTADCDGPKSCLAQDAYSSSRPVFQGAYVYNVNLTDGFKLKGKITHLTSEEEASMKENGYLSNYEKAVQRILTIGENIYTVSQGAVKANAMADLQEKNMIPLAGSTLNGIIPFMK